MTMRNRIAVCVHVYYEDMWDYVVGYLRNIPDGADFYITCRESIYPLISERAARDLGSAEVVTMPNLGMDVLPFLMLCRDKQLHRYDAVLKLHTKNQKSKLRADQGKIMMDGLCGSPELVEQIVEVFRSDPDAGMVGTAFQLRSANALMYGNRERMASLLELLEIDVDDWPLFTGTMFWIAGPLLRDISEITPRLVEQAQSEEAGKTGGDGTLAHALERVFGALSEAAAANVYVTERRDPDSGSYLVVPRRLHGPANRRRFLEVDGTELVRRHVEASHWCRTIRESVLFDEGYYRGVSRDHAVPGMDDIYHFVLYGDLFELNPGPGFDTTYYQLRRQDVTGQKICSLAHYLHAGHRDGTAAEPSEDDWFQLAMRLGLFDGDWYCRSYPDVQHSGLSPDVHYRLIGRLLGRATNMNFRPDRIPVLQEGGREEGSGVILFLKRHYLSERYLYDALKRAGRNGDFMLVQKFTKRILNKYGPGRALNEARAANHTLHRHWTRAQETWEAFWEDIEKGEDSGRHVSSLMQFDRPSKRLPGFETIDLDRISGLRAAEQLDHAPKEHGRVCIYTTLFGNIDNLIPVMEPAEGIDYICFTDREREAKGWRQVIVDPGQPSDNLNAKVFKVLPHRYLQDYEYSMFVDANTVFLGRTAEFVDICRRGGDFVMWQHPLRDDIYTEVSAIIAHRRHSPAKVLDQLRHYSEDGLPRNTGMFEASFIWRRHGDPKVSAFMEEWWDQICSFSSRDQISLAYLVWKTGTRPTLLPRELGTSRENIFFFKARHRHGATRPDAQCNPLLTAPALRNQKRGVTFLYHEKAAGVGSTVLRGQQLSGIVAGHYEGERDVRYVCDPEGLQDDVIILTKGFLKATTQEQLRGLRRNNILVADFVDEPPKRELIGEIDMLMASSLCGYKDYLMSFPDVPAFHVTHHVDTRIPRCEESASDKFLAGYFGELVNTVRHEEIQKLVDFNLVDTSKQSNDWIAALASYNFHYAFRRTRGIDGAKPFLKGFVAAHCGANMMIQKSAGDASFYLGADYPYLMEDDAGPEDIIAALKRASETVGGPEWRYGREIMREVQARSSLDYVMGEFDGMLTAL